ncbi:MAG: hydrolase [Thiothrix sp.]|nr:hydrolase [Thiothrix sp.]HPQ95285.1 hydrolase [Thiolinea sp.]
MALNPSRFRPAWWLPAAHLQTIYPALLGHLPPVTLQRERLELADGDFMELGWMPPHQPEAPVVMLIHGLGGGAASHYVRLLLPLLQQQGYQGLLLALRGSGPEPNRQQRSYHSGASEDLAAVLAILKARQTLPQAIIGVSLGGNLLLKYLGEAAGDDALNGLRTAVAVSVPFHLQDCSQRLTHGFSGLYGRYILKDLRRLLRAKLARCGNPFGIDPERIRTLRQFDEEVTAPVNGFRDAEDYYRRCSSRPFLAAIRTPTLILHDPHDPFMTPRTVPEAEALGPGVTLELCKGAGHVGFVSGGWPWKPDYWLGQRIPEWLSQQGLHPIRPISAAGHENRPDQTPAAAHD